MTHHVRSHDDVNQPYARVRNALLANPSYVFRHATAAATTETAALRVGVVGAFNIGMDVELKVLKILNDYNANEPMTKLSLEWSSKHAPALFPVMWTMLTIHPLPSGDTRLELTGTYQTPFGPAGQVVDAILGHRIADAAVKRFVREVAGWLREELAVAAPTAVAALITP